MVVGVGPILGPPPAGPSAARHGPIETAATRIDVFGADEVEVAVLGEVGHEAFAAAEIASKAAAEASAAPAPLRQHRSRAQQHSTDHQNDAPMYAHRSLIVS